MITTLDNVDCKKGTSVWEVSITSKGACIPLERIVHGGARDVTNPERCWRDVALCAAECDKLNVLLNQKS